VYLAAAASFFLVHTRGLRPWSFFSFSIYKWTSLLELRLFQYIHVDFASGASFGLVYTRGLRYWSFCLVYTREFRFWSFFNLSIYTWTSLLELRLF
jgi:hypothetical protein